VSDRAQHLITGRVSEAMVDPLETFHVNERESHGL
jgi:hypothetical protein